MTDFKVGNPLLIDIGREQEFQRIVPEDCTVGKFHHGQPVVKDLEGGFLPLPVQVVSHDEQGLAFPFGAEVAQATLGGGGAGKLAA